jgi:hypothetical protein
MAKTKPQSKTKTSELRRQPKPVKADAELNGDAKPKGSRNALCQQYIEDLQTAWQKKGIKAVLQLADEDPASFVRAVGALVPRQFDAGDKTESAFEKIWEWIGAQPDNYQPDQD